MCLLLFLRKKWQQFHSLAKYMQIKRAKENKKHKNWPENKRNDLLDAKINKNWAILMVSLHRWVDSTHRQGPVRHLFSLAVFLHISCQLSPSLSLHPVCAAAPFPAGSWPPPRWTLHAGGWWWAVSRCWGRGAWCSLSLLTSEACFSGKSEARLLETLHDFPAEDFHLSTTITVRKSNISLIIIKRWLV